MEFRWIQGDELERLKPVFEQYGWTGLDPIFSRALVAEEDGKIVGFNVLQVVLRPEPLWITPEYRGQRNNDLALNLSTQMINYLKANGCSYWEVRAKSPFVERLCLANGMTKIESPMFAGGVE